MLSSAPEVIIIGGGPGGYEAALTAAAGGATVTLVEDTGVGGASVLTDCVPSKTLIATADFRSRFDVAGRMGVEFSEDDGDPATHEPLAHGVEAHIDLAAANRRVMDLARAQSADIRAALTEAGVTVVDGRGRLVAPDRVQVTAADGSTTELTAATVLLATGASPRVLPSARPDGERILTWQQVWDLTELPSKLVVVGSGVTGAELAHAYLGLGCEVVLVSSRDRVLPGEDPDAAEVLETVFRERGMQVMNGARAQSVERQGDEVLVTLTDGRTVTGSHCIMAVGSVPNTADLGLEEVGVQTADSGHVLVDKVSRTSVRGVYAAGDCTAVLPLASVAAMQGRIAMSHALGDAVSPLRVTGISSNIFTDPEIATVGIGQKQVDEGEGRVHQVMLPLVNNPRAKMRNVRHGFVKLYAAQGSDVVVGGVVVGPQASELIYPVALAVHHRLTVDQVASTFTVYPSMSGSVAEAARRLHTRED
ncbi:MULTISPECIES: NAD(P)H-quinone dehydrogenase [Kytococcus]|uniref:NAD(P)H dehydrogenase (quinone) n=1 Tax=Kytococcus schroeteri TaxID=138300 RepID=A0A2I1P908_9MICO|nr:MULTISPECIES: NAD(P)H-quinone dehydrogenase [Kytococcus]OFS15363.1 flavoprotein disulfide reductase [Kytococcus sp. HMSC28H12]PKZ41119.1 NAD(P)H-quinone dehydrogenase [Kytococcus schroeteri]